eukprot:m.6828 g.6828  ORF g.6828 m.6828 type:complete len:144 (-) comp8606_c0_seq5:642-1073(-)
MPSIASLQHGFEYQSCIRLGKDKHLFRLDTSESASALAARLARTFGDQHDFNEVLQAYKTVRYLDKLQVSADLECQHSVTTELDWLCQQLGLPLQGFAPALDFSFGNAICTSQANVAFTPFQLSKRKPDNTVLQSDVLGLSCP